MRAPTLPRSASQALALALALFSASADGPTPLVVGNIDLSVRPYVANPDGSTSTVRSMGVQIDGLEYLIPTVHPCGYLMDADAAIDLFLATRAHLGAYRTIADAERAAIAIHDAQAACPPRRAPACSIAIR